MKEKPGTPAEIKMAVEQNARDRGTLLVQVIVSLHVDEVLDLVDKLSDSYAPETFEDIADKIGIRREALKRLDKTTPRIPYPRYFCTPDVLMEHPMLVFYYRNVAMLSRKVMRGIGLGTDNLELVGEAPTKHVAQQLSNYFNCITSNLILESDITPHRHIMMMMANLGDSLGGTSRNQE